LIETTISPSADFDSPRKNHSFEARPGPAGRPGTRPTRGWNWDGLKKK